MTGVQTCALPISATLTATPSASDSRAAAESQVDGDQAVAGGRPADRAPSEAEAVAQLLDRLGVSHVVVRHDLVAAGDPRWADTVAQLPGWRPLGHFDVATVVERVRPAPLLDAVAVEPGATAPTMAWVRRDPAHYEVALDAADGDFVLTLAETFGPGWQLSGLPRGWTADHGVVDGYANGWRIDGDGSATLRLTHRPSDVARVAALVSAAVLAAVVLFTVAGSARRRLPVPPPQA